MKALTLWQPWASLIYVAAMEPDLGKLVETRSRQMHYRGTLAIHSAGKMPASARALYAGSAHCRRALSFLGVKTVEDLDDEKLLPRCAVIAVVEVVACESTNLPGPVQRDLYGEARTFERPAPGTAEYDFGGYGPDRWMIFMENVRGLSEPVPAKGQRSMWTPDAALEARIRERL
jgi:hypothetical protein